MELCWLRVKLRQWGCYSRVIVGGYPSMATTERARIGRGGVFEGRSLPPDLEEIDHFVSCSPADHKRILVEHYTKDGDYREHAARLQLSVDAYYRSRKRAEVYLNTVMKSQMKDVSYARAELLPLR